jgi:hypothetical protein
VGYIEQAEQKATALGLGGPFVDCQKLMRRADGLDGKLAALRAASERAWSKLVGDLVAGRMPEPAEVAAVAGRCELWDGRAAKALDVAAAVCRRDALAAGKVAIPHLWSLMQATVADVVKESVELARGLPAGVTTAEQAYELGPDSGTKWVRLRKLHQRWVGVHDLDEYLRVSDLVDRYAVIPQDRAASWLFFEHPEKLPARFGEVAPELRLPVAHARGAGPGLYPAGEAMQRRNAIHPPARYDSTPMNQYSRVG